MAHRAATLDDVRITEALLTRTAAPRDLAGENAAFLSIARSFSGDTSTLLHALTSAALGLCGAGTCGVSLVEPGAAGEVLFRWVALSGELRSYEGGTTPRRFSPCGITLDAGSPQLFKYPARYYPYFNDAFPTIVECLVMPFNRSDDVMGTIWIVAHDEATRFTQSHVVVMAALADFTAAALAVLREERHARELAETERDARQDAQEANRVKDLFLATVSHELRTPLNSMLGWSELLVGGELGDADTQLAVSVIHHNALRQVRLIDDLLDLSRATAGEIGPACTPVDIRQAVREVVDAAIPEATAAGLSLETTFGSGEAFVSGDAERLQQVVGNLICNAVKFTPAGGAIRVELSAEEGAGYVTLEVSDTGIGITPECLPRIFERFFQADPSTTRRHQGLGLGLTLAQSIVTRHGGRISARSGGVGHGASFTVVLPRATGLAIPAAPVTMAPAVKGTVLDGIHVLVVDDDPDTREVLALMLAQHGATVCTAASAPEALDLMAGRQVHVLLADIAMPGEDGYALIARIRAAEHAGRRRVSVAALTARGNSDDWPTLMAAGFDRYLQKPIGAAELVSSVAALAQSGHAF